MKKTLPALFAIVFLLPSCDADPMDANIGLEPRYLTITYHSEGHTSGAAPMDARRYVAPQLDENAGWIVEPETAVILGQGALEKDGFYFWGWRQRIDGSFQDWAHPYNWRLMEGDEVRMDFGSMALDAIWAETPAPEYFTVTYHSEGHTSGEVPIATGRYPVGRSYGKPPRPLVPRGERHIVIWPETLKKEGHGLGVQRPDGRRGDRGGRAWDGGQKQVSPFRPDIPFGQGLAVLLARLPRCVAGGLPRRPPEHEPQGRVLGQCVRGVFFRNAEAGA